MAQDLHQLKSLTKKSWLASVIGWPRRLAADPISPTVPPPNNGAGNPQLIPKPPTDPQSKKI
jgi:hypothetical protein